jgi:hypothetical protein
MVPDAKTVGITVCMVFGKKNDVSLISIVDLADTPASSLNPGFPNASPQ